MLCWRAIWWVVGTPVLYSFWITMLCSGFWEMDALKISSPPHQSLQGKGWMVLLPVKQTKPLPPFRYWWSCYWDMLKLGFHSEWGTQRSFTRDPGALVYLNSYFDQGHKQFLKIILSIGEMALIEDVAFLDFLSHGRWHIYLWFDVKLNPLVKFMFFFHRCSSCGLFIECFL